MTTAMSRRDPDARPRATYRDVLDAPPHRVAEIRVTATDPGGLSATQSFVRVSTTVTGSFTDDPLRPGVTPVKAVHFTELRTRIDALRRTRGLQHPARVEVGRGVERRRRRAPDGGQRVEEWASEGRAAAGWPGRPDLSRPSPSG